MTRRRLPREYNLDGSGVLTMRYTVECEIKAPIRPGGGSYARAVEDCIRHLCGQSNVNPESIKFTVD